MQKSFHKEGDPSIGDSREIRVLWIIRRAPARALTIWLCRVVRMPLRFYYDRSGGKIFRAIRAVGPLDLRHKPACVGQDRPASTALTCSLDYFVARRALAVEVDSPDNTETCSDHQLFR